jgi:hypothetical protein
MTTITKEELLQKSTVVKQIVDDGLMWVKNNVEEDKKDITISELKRIKRHLKRYSEAINKRPAIAIFGQSQVGKSYLVSNLTKQPEAYSLLVKIPGTGDEIDFIKNINPPGGGKEATGLVTRFTTADTYQDGWKPFELKMFTQADIVNVIANGYLSDITHYVYSIDREKIQKKISELSLKKDKSIQPGFSEDDVYNIKEYLFDRFRDHFLIKDLNSINFWDDLAKLIPYINPAQRWEILEFIWGQQSFFTNLFKELTQGLSQIKFKKSVRTDIDALTPQSDTILDVERLRELYKSKENKKTPVKLYEGNELLTEMDRSILSALTAEVIMPLSDQTAEHPQRQFLKEADVLDFPGARSRQQIPENTFAEKNNEDKLLVFLRGKVAYLFDNYNTNFEVSTLMFCMDNKQPEVTDLPKFLYDWISKVHGNSAEKREERERHLETLVQQSEIERIIPLLVILTKFNIELQGNPATEQEGDLKAHDAKWSARIGANFADQMSISVSDPWIDKWNLKGPFKNVFPLRDPKWSKAVYEGFDSNGKETGIRPEYVQKMADMQKSWTNHPDVIKHFHNPLEAWKNVTELNKSGLDYIVKYLTPTCDPIIKNEQIKGRIEELIIELKNLLASFYKGGTIDEKLQKARINAAQAFMQIMKMQNEKNTFGHLLNFLMINENLSWKIFFDMMMKEQISDTEQTSEQQETEGKTIPIDLIEMLKQFIDISEADRAEDILTKLKEYFAIDDTQTLNEVMKQSGINIETLLQKHNSDEKPQNKYDKSFIYAKKLLSAWLAHINDLKDDKTLKSLGLQKNIAEIILQELNKSKNRINLKKIIAENTREHIKMFQLTSNIDIVARISTNIINKFINSFGWEYEAEEKRPKIKKTDQYPIFADIPVKTPTKKELQLGIDFPGENLFVQWTTGMRSSFEANVYYEENVKDASQAEADAKLGLIIKKIPA